MTTNPAGGGRLTTHVLDTAAGTPATGVAIALFRLSGDGGRTLLREATTNRDGRCDGPLLAGVEFVAGTYELVFRVGEHFARGGVTLPEPAFLSEVPVRFGISDPQAHYHVPLLISPYGYSTYRGS
jgi:5-hydroxyisourate hydrolase